MALGNKEFHFSRAALLYESHILKVAADKKNLKSLHLKTNDTCVLHKEGNRALYPSLCNTGNNMSPQRRRPAIRGCRLMRD